MYIYAFKNKKNKKIYIGKTNNIARRISQHFSNFKHLPEGVFKEVSCIEITKCESEMEMNIKELLLISYYKPKYNLEFKNDDCFPKKYISEIEDLEWVLYKTKKELQDMINKKLDYLKGEVSDSSRITKKINDEEFEKITKAIKCGFTYEDKTGKKRKFRPAPKLALILRFQKETGLNIKSVLEIKEENFSCEKDYKIKIQNISNECVFDISGELYRSLMGYLYNYPKNSSDYIFDMKVRNVQQQLAIVCKYLGIKHVSTSSLRKNFTRVLITI